MAKKQEHGSMKGQRGQVAAEAFVKAWQGSKTLDEIEQKTGMFRTRIQSRATLLRGRGVPLKHFKRTLDIPALTKLAKECEK